MVWHYHDDDLPGPDAGGAAQSEWSAGERRSCAAHALPHRRDAQQCVRRVEAHGSPIAPTRPQYTRLEAAGQLERLDAPSSLRVVDREATSRLRAAAARSVVDRDRVGLDDPSD